MRSVKEQLRASDGAVWVVGHRGAMARCPENTMAAFQAAIDLGASWVELDVHLTRDGALAVIHDEGLERTTNGAGLVNEYTLEQLQRLDAGSWFAAEYAGQRIPSLDEVLAWARERDVVVDVEIKNAPSYYAGIEQTVVATLDRHGMSEQVLVSSFDHPAVERVRSLDGRIATGVLYAHRPLDALAMARSAHADVLLPQWPYVVPEDVEAAHAAGLRVIPWGPASESDILMRLLRAGVDGIISNDPAVLRQVLDESGTRSRAR
jgi:glycerophosphoryl diester phosphodiesterase